MITGIASGGLDPSLGFLLCFGFIEGVMRAFVSVAVVSMLAPSLAFAACPAVVSPQQIDAELAAVEKELNDADFDLASRMLKQIGEHFTCLQGPVKTSQIAQYSLERAELAFFEQDEETANHWAVALRTITPSPAYPPAIGPDHPFRSLVRDAPEPIIGTVKGKAFAVGKRGYVFLNGVPIATPQAKAEVPSLVQVFDRGGRLQSAAWQDGAAFPDAMLVPGDYALETNPAFSATSSEKSPKTPKTPKTPTEKPVKEGGGPSVPLIAVGGGLAVGAGVLYALGGMAAGNLGNATNEDDLTATRTQANLMVLGAGVAGAAAVGLTVSAFVSTDSAWIGFRTRF